MEVAMPSTQLVHDLQKAGLDADDVITLIERALAEDVGFGVDATSVATIDADQRSTGRFVLRRPGVVAGLPVAAAVMAIACRGDVEISAHHEDGEQLQSGASILSVTGPTRGLLLGERTSLNLLGHLSGIATLTKRWVDEVSGTGCRIRDTRKTTPGLRVLEKYAVRCGGGTNHRMTLSEAAMIKDNHIVAAGSLTAAFGKVRATFPDLPVEVEADTLEQVKEALAAGVDLILLDNMSIEECRAAVAIVSGRAELEASGGLVLENAHAYAATGVTYLAVGSLTHSAPVLDIGLDLIAN
jgi:nicotinate-nucleotide pyrophosphorylase (carboxylating)